MTFFLKCLIPNCILVISMLYICHKLLNKSINLKNIKLYITIIGLMIISLLNYFGIDSFIKIVTMTLILMLFFKYYFKEELKICIITPIFYQLILLISEVVCAIILSLIFKSNPTLLLNSIYGIYITNILISLTSIILFKFKYVIKIYKLILNFTNRIKNFQLIMMCLIIMVFLNFFYYTSYYKIDFQYLILLNVSFTAVFCMIVFYSFKTQNNYNEVSDKYNIAINSLNDYEVMMSKYRIANHENKNLLLTVRAMIINKEKDIPKYIDSIIEEKYVDDEKLLFKMNTIPTGGLRASIYSEILKIKDNGIIYYLNIDKKIRTTDLIKIDTTQIINICKIVGVFVDNAIDEVRGLKDGYIGINIYIQEKNLNIKISNNYSNIIEVDKIFNEGYTTKGFGRGYGLTLVDNIVKESSKFERETEISKNEFSQILVIKNIKK